METVPKRAIALFFSAPGAVCSRSPRSRSQLSRSLVAGLIFLSVALFRFAGAGSRSRAAKLKPAASLYCELSSIPRGGPWRFISALSHRVETVSNEVRKKKTHTHTH